MKKSLRFVLTLGVNEGYVNNASQPDMAAIGELYKTEALAVMEETGLYISSVMQAGACLYNTEWGCPVGGEPSVIFAGSLNPAFLPEGEGWIGVEKWKRAVQILADRMKTALKQTTATLEFVETEYLYMQTPKEE